MAALVEVLTEIKNQCNDTQNAPSQEFITVFNQNNPLNLDYNSMSQHSKLDFLSDLFAKFILSLDPPTLNKLNFISSIIKQIKTPVTTEDLQEIYNESSQRGSSPEFKQKCIKKLNQKIRIEIKILNQIYSIELIKNTSIKFRDYLQIESLPHDDLYLRFSQGNLILSQNVSSDDSDFYYYAKNEVRVEPGTHIIVDDFKLNFKQMINQEIIFEISKYPPFQNFILSRTGIKSDGRQKIRSEFQNILYRIKFEWRENYFHLKYQDNTEKIFFPICKSPQTSPLSPNNWIYLSEHQKLNLYATSVNNPINFSINFKIIT